MEVVLSGNLYSSFFLCLFFSTYLMLLKYIIIVHPFCQSYMESFLYFVTYLVLSCANLCLSFFKALFRL